MTAKIRALLEQRLSPIEKLLSGAARGCHQRNELHLQSVGRIYRERLFTMEHRWKGGQCYCRMCEAKRVKKAKIGR